MFVVQKLEANASWFLWYTCPEKESVGTPNTPKMADSNTVDNINYGVIRNRKFPY